MTMGLLCRSDLNRLGDSGGPGGPREVIELKPFVRLLLYISPLIMEIYN